MENHDAENFHMQHLINTHQMDIVCLYVRVMGNGLTEVCNDHERAGMKLVAHGVTSG